MLIRKLLPDDRVILSRMIAADAEHTARGMTADFFHVPPPNRISLCFEDDDGPVFYVRLDCESPTSIRIHMQFDEATPLRTARLLVQGFEVVKAKCQEAGAEHMVFDSLNARLREFCMRRFGFTPVSGTADLELELPVAAPSAPPRSKEE